MSVISQVTSVMNRRPLRSPLLLCGLISVFALSCAKAQSPQIHAENVGESGHPTVTVLPHPALTKGGGDVSIADIAERVLPSVVNISMTKVTKMGGVMPFMPFFGGGQEDRREQGMGSGVIVSADGYVLTNNHVVADAQEIKVTTSDRRNYDATVVGTDPKSDLAVIKIKGDVKNLRPVEFGDSGQLRLGDVVLAIGNPFGVGQTVTMGIVSAKGRSDMGIEAYEDFIQTDAAINPGNSGGALDGIVLEGLNPQNRHAFDIDDSVKQGVVITRLDPQSNAARAGLRPGDVVLEINRTRVDSPQAFQELYGKSKSRVLLLVNRHGSTTYLVVKG